MTVDDALFRVNVRRDIGGDLDDMEIVARILADEIERLRERTGRWSKEMRAVLEPCVECDFDEASGDLFCHCGKCKHRITSKVWEIFATQVAAEAAGG